MEGKNTEVTNVTCKLICTVRMEFMISVGSCLGNY